MSLLDDPSLDERARPILDARPFPPPTDASLQAALLLDDEPSAAMLEEFARWLDRIAELQRAGFGPEELLRIALRGLRKGFATGAPPAQILNRLFAISGGDALARALCEELAAQNVAKLPFPMRAAAHAALIRLAAADALDARDGALIDWDRALDVIPAMAAALPLAKREPFVLANATNEGSPPTLMLETLLATRAAVDSPALAAIRERHLEAARDYVARIEDDDDRAEEEQRLAELAEAHATPPRPPVERPTASARRALAYLDAQREAKLRAARLGPLAEELWASRTISVDAPELATVDAWMAADGARQRQVALAVAAAVGGTLDGLHAFGANTIAVIMVGGVPYCLVPGGAVEMGLSPEEEAAVRAAAEANAGCANHFELYGSLLERARSLRPLTVVRVGPLLAQQEPLHPVAPAEITTRLEHGPFRLPSEAEWEHLARGGVAREPTYVGPEVPDAEGWLPRVGSQGAKLANDFGLWGFGFEPEVCADVWHPTHEGAADDGSPRRGAGPRVVRGGAGQLYPFQSAGEWQLLLSAMRTHQRSWEFAQSMRWVIRVVLR